MQFIKKTLFLIFFTTSLYSSQKVSILIIHSYSQEYKWTKNQHNSFVSTLKESGGNFDFYTEYLDTKRLKPTSEYQKEFFKYLKLKYTDADIDLLYVTDDNALNFIVDNYKELLKHKKRIPIFFSGINNLDADKTLPKESFAGVYEVKEIKPNIELIKQFSPQTRDIWFIGDDSNTYNSIKKELQLQENDFSNMTFHYISDEYISKVKEKLPNSKRKFAILTTIGNFKDSNNRTLLPNESINFIRENKKLIILSMEDAYMSQGVVGGFMTSAKKQGEEAAKLVLKYLNENSLKNVSSLLKSPNVYMFNSKELSNSRVVLSEYIARNSTIIGQDKSFSQKNKELFLNMFLIFLLFLSLLLTTLYAIQRKKSTKLLARITELQDMDKKLHSEEQLVKNIFNLDNISYWKLDTKNNKLFISDELVDTLGIDTELYGKDPEFLSYFLNPADKILLSQNISYVKDSKKSIKFTHKVITSSRSVYDVKHIIFAQESADSEPLTIIGIIKFEK